MWFLADIPGSITLQPATALTIVTAVTSSFIGLVVWMVKHAARRQDKVTDRFIDFMGRLHETNQRTQEQHAAAIANLAGSVSAQTEQLERHTSQLEGMSLAVERLAGRPRAKARTAAQKSA